jgi:hypothetical protein
MIQNPSTAQRMNQLLIFWNLAAGRQPSAQLAADAQLKLRELRQFRQKLNVSNRVTPEDQRLLRQDYRTEDLAERLAARKRFLGFVRSFKTQFPSLGESLPEILTVWGEARDLGGFKEEDDWIQQAKMASIVHVLRNRATHFCRRSPKRCQVSPAELRWRLATRRFQFSAFEPFDPNLAEIAFGPRSRPQNIGAMPPLDARALYNLMRVVEKMEKGWIEILDPLGDSATRHYLTPDLVPFNRDNERRLRAQAARQKRRQVLRFPRLVPTELSLVPNWADPDKWIENPVVVIRVDENETRKLSIPREDFIYFKGVL